MNKAIAWFAENRVSANLLMIAIIALGAISLTRMKLEIFPNGQLGSETDSIEQVQRGVLAMVKTSTAPLEGFIPEMSLFGLPYVFRDSEHYWNVLLGAVGKELLDNDLSDITRQSFPMMYSAFGKIQAILHD